MPPWIIQDSVNLKMVNIINDCTISIGNSDICNLNIQTKIKKKIIYQAIFEDNFLFLIMDNKTLCFYKESIININKVILKISSSEHLNIKNIKKIKELCPGIFLDTEFKSIVENIQNFFVNKYSKNFLSQINQDEVLNKCCENFSTEFFKINDVFNPSVRELFYTYIWCFWCALFSYGPITDLLLDEEVSEIMVNGTEHIYVEKKGKISLSTFKFIDHISLISVIERICSSTGRRIDESIPYCDTRLKEGYRVHAIIPPLSLSGPCLTIRKFPSISFDISKLIEINSIKKQGAEILMFSVINKKNILISGGTGTGKTTFLNCISSFVPESERIITIEDSAELNLKQNHVIRLETRNSNSDGKGQITIRDLVKNSLRMRPDRIIVGECRGGEAIDMLQAMNTGHNGSMTTIHANSTSDALRRLETLVLFSELDLASRAIKEQIASSINIIIQLNRDKNGHRYVSSIDEIVCYNPTTTEIQLNNLYRN